MGEGVCQSLTLPPNFRFLGVGLHDMRGKLQHYPVGVGRWGGHGRGVM